MFETWGSKCEEEEEQEKEVEEKEGSLSPNPTTPKASGDALCLGHHSSFSWNPGHGLVYFGARALQGPPPIHPIRLLKMVTLMPS